jgi:uncharacterized protein involved in exopolysaccharide biosynthesis
MLSEIRLQPFAARSVRKIRHLLVANSPANKLKYNRVSPTRSTTHEAHSMKVSRKSSEQNVKTSKQSRTSNTGLFSDDSMFSDESRFSKISKFFSRSKEVSESQLFQKYRESIDLDLSQYIAAVRRHWLPAVGVFVVTVGVSAFATTLLKPSYEAAGKLLFKSPTFSAIGSSVLPNAQEGTVDLKSLVASQNPISTQMEVISSPPILQKAIDKLQLKDIAGKSLEVEVLERSLKLQIVGGADVLRITYKSGKPEEAAAIVNAIVDVYLENDILINRNEARSLSESISKQIPANQAAVRVAEEALKLFKQKNNIVNLAEESRSAVGTISTLDAQIDGVRAELNRETAQTNQLRQQAALNSQDGISASALSQSPAIKATLTELQEIERQLAVKRSLFENASPAIVDLEAKKTNLKNLLQKQIIEIGGERTSPNRGLLQIGELRQTLIANFLASDVQRLGLAQKLASLQTSRTNYEQRVRSLPQLEQQQRDLERKLEIPQSTYQNLQKKLKELQLAENNDRATARIINKASVPKEPAPSMKFLFLLLGGMSGAFLATVLIVLLEIRHNAKNRAKVGKVSSLEQRATQLHSEEVKLRSKLNVRNITEL